MNALQSLKCRGCGGSLSCGLDGQGRLQTQYEGLWAGRGLDHQTLRFENLDAQNVVTQLPALLAGIGPQVSQAYGFRLLDPKYRLDLDLTPEVRVGLEADFEVWSRTFRTDWLAVNALRLNVGEVELERHVGTPREYRFEGGLKSFLALRQDSPAAEPFDGRNVALVSVGNGRQVRGGLTQGCFLGATSQQTGGWETFRLENLGEGRVALRCQQNGLLVRAGVGRQCALAATSARPDRWETFQLIPLGRERYGLRSLANRLYVSVDENGRLNASSHQ